MKEASPDDAKAVTDAVAAGEPIPSGFAFDGTTAFALDAEDEDRIADGGPVEEPEDPAALNPTPADQTPVVNPEDGDEGEE